MEIKVWIRTNQWCCEERDEFDDDGFWADVEVPLIEIAGIIAKRYGITAEAMNDIICDYDLDLGDDIENDDEIKELAYEYWRERNE